MARFQNATRPARLYRPRLTPGRLPLEAPCRPDRLACRERLHIRMRRAGPDAATTIPTAQEVALPVCPVRTIPQVAATPRHAPALPQSLFQKITCLVEGTLEEAAARGDWADLQWLWRHMQDTDVTVASAVAKRLSYIESLDWEIRTIENSDAILAAEQEAVLRYAYERIQNLQEAAKFIAYANFTGYSML